MTPDVVKRYYANREALFAAAMRLPFDPATSIAQLIAPGVDGLGDRMVRVTLRMLDDPETRDQLALMVRDGTDPVTTSRPADLRPAAEAVLREHGIIQPKDGYAGVSGDEKVLTLQWQAEKMFYRESEIRARGRKVNEQLKPDLVLCLHFNAASWGNPEQPQYSAENHLHVMINGCYAADELQFQDIRFEMLQRLFLRMHEEELPLAGQVATAMAESTGLPPYVYATPNARLAGPSTYVYARNLLANRIYQCPVVYLEPYVMNNEDTYQRLLMGDYIGSTLFKGRLRTSIFEDYVQGVVNGLTNYYRLKRAS